MYLFDTDVITNVFKKKPSPLLLKRLAATPQETQHISVITLAEIVYGAEKSTSPRHHLENLEKILLPAVNIVPFDAKAAYVCGRLQTKLEKQDSPMALADLEIAAIAIANNLTLVTVNLRHFSRVSELAVENWLV